MVLEVPFLRPSNISHDTSIDFEYISHTVEWLRKNNNYNPDIIIQLRPTQPCRSVETLIIVLIFLKNYNNYDSLRTVVKAKKSPYKMYYISNNNLIPYFKNFNNIEEPYNIGRQQLPDSFVHNGYIDILKPSLLSNNKISGDKIFPYIMKDNENIDIDDIKDWDKAESKLLKKLI